MTLARKSSRIYMDEFDVDGLLKVLDRRAAESTDSIVWARYSGAARAISIISYHDYIDTQADFMRLFEKDIPKEGK